MPRSSPILLLKRGLLFFWALWLTIVCLTNLADAAKALGVLGHSWRFASGNFQFIAATTARYGTPNSVNGIMFGGVILWEAIAAGLFWRAAWVYRDMSSGRRAVQQASAISVFLWSAFLIADELCIAYALEATHFRLLIAQIVTLLAIELLPDR